MDTPSFTRRTFFCDKHELVVGNVLRSVHCDFLNGLCHGQVLHDGRPGASPRTSKPVKKPPLPPLPLGAAAASWQGNTAVVYPARAAWPEPAKDTLPTDWVRRSMAF